MSDSPAAVIFDENGVAIAVEPGTAVPANTPGLFIVGSDGTNARFLRMATDGTLRIDPTGTTTQPVSVASLPLPTGAATEATLATRLADATFTARIPTIGQKASAGSLSVVVASDQTVPISAVSLPLPTGAATEATLSTRLSESAWSLRTNTLGQKAMAGSMPIVIASDQTVIPVSDNAGSLTVDTPQLPAALVGGRLTTNVGAWLGSTAPTVGQKAMASSVPVVISSDQSTVSTQPVKSGTGTTSNVTATTSTVTILAANASRLGATVFNDSNKALFLKAGSGASTTSFTVNVPRNGYYEVPYDYTGILTGIWGSGVSGAARVTEFT